ncbi:hypothetical protein Misp06_02214 [Microbulbifer sp. NBRC 101763]
MPFPKRVSKTVYEQSHPVNTARASGLCVFTHHFYLDDQSRWRLVSPFYSLVRFDPVGDFYPMETQIE